MCFWGSGERKGDKSYLPYNGKIMLKPSSRNTVSTFVDTFCYTLTHIYIWMCFKFRVLYYYYHYCGVSPLSPCFAFVSALFNCPTVSQRRIRPQLHFQNKACLKTLLMFYHEIWSGDLAGKRFQQLTEQWKSKKRLHKVLSFLYERSNIMVCHSQEKMWGFIDDYWEM